MADEISLIRSMYCVQSNHDPVRRLLSGGVKQGHVPGSTDDSSSSVTESPVHVHDLQAAILQLPEIDHERLTYRHSGRDYRLTNLIGRVVSKIIS